VLCYPFNRSKVNLYHDSFHTAPSFLWACVAGSDSVSAWVALSALFYGSTDSWRQQQNGSLDTK
jgi:hypothetical protein